MEGKDREKEITLRELLKGNQRWSEEVLAKVVNITSLESNEAAPPAPEPAVPQGIRGELVQTRENLRAASIALQAIWNQLREKSEEGGKVK